MNNQENNSKNIKGNNEKLYDQSLNAEKLKHEDEELDGGSETEGGTKTIHTSETRILDGSHREVLIGKDLEDIEKVKEKQKSIQKTLLDRLTR